MSDLRWLWAGLKFGLPDLGLGVEGHYILLEEPPEGLNTLCSSVNHEASVYVAISD